MRISSFNKVAVFLTQYILTAIYLSLKYPSYLVSIEKKASLGVAITLIGIMVLDSLFGEIKINHRRAIFISVVSFTVVTALFGPEITVSLFPLIHFYLFSDSKRKVDRVITGTTVVCVIALLINVLVVGKMLYTVIILSIYMLMTFILIRPFPELNNISANGY